MALRIAAAAATALVLVPATAAALTIGANLRRPANSTFDCRVQPLPDAFGNPLAFPSFQRTCTWFTVGRSAFDSREGTAVPVGRGTITSVRVKVGARTGPMRVVVLELLRSGGPVNFPDTICCKQVAQTATFTPRRNRVTTLRTNFAVRNSGTVDRRTGFAYYDVLAISVLAPGVPVPLSDTGNYRALGGPLATAMYPALRQREERAGGSGEVGWIVLINGTWVRRR